MSSNLGDRSRITPLEQRRMRFYTVSMYSIKRIHKPDKPPFQSVRRLAQLRERLRYLHYSIKTEKNYVYWARFFIRWSGLRHPREMGVVEVEAFLTYLANSRKVSVCTPTLTLPCQRGRECLRSDWIPPARERRSLGRSHKERVAITLHARLKIPPRCARPPLQWDGSGQHHYSLGALAPTSAGAISWAGH
jgi:hypothetical protein